MKKILLLCTAFTLSLALSAQTTAQDFTKPDCKGKSHHLFAELDSGYCVLIEFAMLPGCQPCISSGKKIEHLKTAVNAEHPGQMRWYVMEFSGEKTCAQIESWKTTSTITSLGFEDGHSEVGYYGGMGMPTVVLLGGADHQVLWKKIGNITNSDTAAIHAEINEFFAVSGTNEAANSVTFALSPNPVTDALTISLNDPAADMVRTVAVFDAAGAKIISEIWASAIIRTIGVASLPRGLYILALLNESGQIIGRQQFVKN